MSEINDSENIENESEPNWESLIDPLHVYNIVITDVYDGDTITCDIELGFNLVFKDQKIRLYGINAPEVKGTEKPRGITSKANLIELLGINSLSSKKIKLYTINTPKSGGAKKEKFGRWLGILMCDNVNINKKIVELGYAKYKNYE